MKEIDSISRAITIVGFNEVIGLTIGMNVFSKFSKKDTHGIFDIEILWLHSIACATTARMIAKKKRMGDIDKIFLTALLHDMGKVIFAKYFPEEYHHVYEAVKNGANPLSRHEKKALGINHAELSGLMMKRWKFPDDLLLPCLYHHRSDQCPPQSRTIAAIVELSDLLCLKAKMGSGNNGCAANAEPLRQMVRLSGSEMEYILDELKQQRANMEEFLEIMK